MRHTNENDDTRIVDAIRDDAAPSSIPSPSDVPADPFVRPSFSHEVNSGSRSEETPTMLRGDDAAPYDLVAGAGGTASTSTRQAGLEGTRYEVVRAIGEGGMGTVYLANQVHPVSRQVAIKVVRKGPEIARFKKRFVNERQALSRLDHPHIAKFLEAGQTHGGRPYYVMEYVPGMALTDFCDYHQFDLRQRLRLFIQVCDAVAHAHTKAIIHRDLKPSNVLAYMLDEKPMTKVIDFGLAKVTQLDDESLHRTRLGAIIGSSYYMSPEQSTGSSDVDTRSDVYSLGVILYELLAGVRPFERSMFPRVSELDFLRLMSSTTAMPPSARLTALTEEEQERIARRRQVSIPQLAKVLARELEWIPLKALRLEPERRYDGPNELAEDIKRYLDSEALIAGPESWRYTTSKWLSRNRSLVIATSSTLLLLLAVAGGASFLYFNTVSKQAQLNATLGATIEDKTALEERLASELASRLAMQRQEKLSDPKWEAGVPTQSLLREERTRRIDLNGVVHSRFHAPHTQWKTAPVALPFIKLSDLVRWSVSKAGANFSGFTAGLPSAWNKSADGEGNVLIDDSLNVLPYAECERNGDAVRVSRIVLFIYCEDETQFDELVAPTRSLLQRQEAAQTDTTAASSVLYSGPVRIEFRPPRGPKAYPWGTITIHPASVSR